MLCAKYQRFKDDYEAILVLGIYNVEELVYSLTNIFWAPALQTGIVCIVRDTTLNEEGFGRAWGCGIVLGGENRE